MKPVILTFIQHYLPGYRAGGPIRTIANMVEHLSDEFKFMILTLDRDIGDTLPYPSIQADSWMPREKAMVRYVSPRGFRLRAIANIVRSTPHSVIYLNSFFSPRFTQQVLVNQRLGRLSGRPIVIAPRGEFSKGALRIKYLKKCAFIRLARFANLYEGLTWQASSAREVDDIRRVLSVGEDIAGSIVVAPNLVGSEGSADSSNMTMVQHKFDRPLRVCFLSRISRKKNLDFALRVLEQVGVAVRFTIYGAVEDPVYWAECEALIAKLPANIEVVNEGAIEPAQVLPKLMQSHLLLFPTRGENFGHVIHEALRAGLPLLISDQTPWQQLEEQGVGWDLPLANISAFARRIEEVSGWSDMEYELWAARARALAFQVANDPGTIEANRRLFLDAIGNAIPAKNQAIGEEDGKD